MAVAALLLFAATAAGQEGEFPNRPTDMQFGRLLFDASRLRDAEAFLEQARPANEDETIERLFLLGRIAMQQGRPREAAKRFEAILARRPDFTRVRLELATAYYAAERDDKARLHFERAMADRLPSSVETAVERFLDRIDNRKRWSASVSVALAPESNPAKRTREEMVRIGGAPFRLDEDSREASGTGVMLSGGASWTPRIGDGLRAVLAASGSTKRYRQKEWNDLSAAVEAGAARVLDGSNLSGGLRAGRRWLGNDGYSRSLGPWLRGGARLSASTRLNISVDLLRFSHDDRPDLDGWRWTARTGLVHAVSSRSSLEVGLDLEHVSARTGRHGSRMAGMSLSFAHAFRGGLSVTPSLAIHQRRYAGRDPLFDRVREDITIRPSIRLLHRALQYGDFAPWIGYSHERNRSNIAIHSWRNQAVLIGVSRRF
ncbi:MAG: surface lipoprotein assembly modifier [Alphaproteobacteria bacterium]|nr:surface lipoprotein assembly modifier [Alphaproteobacteria bacterium]